MFLSEYNIGNANKNEMIAKLLPTQAYLYKSTSAALLRMISSIVHELRTPTNAISGMITLIEPLLSHENKKYITTAQISCDLLINLINDILDLGKLEEGRIVLSKAPYDVIKVIKKCSYMVSFPVEQKGISLLINTNLINTMRIVGDERRLTQILLNLLSNAVKFTSGGKICVNMEYTNQNLVIQVEDTGAGIKDEDKCLIFKPFTQLEATSNVNQSGTGLGLYISRELARKMNGEITFTSKFCIGTKFTITLFKVEIVDQGTNECQIVRRRMRTTAPCKILVIDDNTFNLFSISSLLTKQGFKCTTCLSGIKAIEECKTLYESQKSFYKLILMDIEMPIMNGFEVRISPDYNATQRDDEKWGASFSANNWAFGKR